MHAVGIDLGTTNSVVAVEGNFPDKGKVCEHVTVIADDVGRFTQASAVCEVEGEIIVGDDAKELAAQGFTPVRFAKKYMGTHETFRVGTEEWSAVQVSAKVLQRMCSMVEQALGGKIQNAVVTHPAYFDALAIAATKEAALLIGLNVELMMEPIAAAMAYTFKDTSALMRVLVYDLGGGTFDVTLVERTSGRFLPRAFGGNRELGGYNFDKRIATKMLNSLREKNYKFNIDQDRPELDARWACLMHHAEQLKIKLSSSPKAELRMPGIFRDDSTPPKAVSMAFAITRQEFLDLIENELNETITATRAVLTKAGCQTSEINHLVLVGGSSRIPVIHERLEKEFGLKPVCDEDTLDLSVAIGAAMAASQMGKLDGQVLLENVPAVTDMQKLTISGRVLPGDEVTDLANCVVTVRGGIDDETTITGGNGGFHMTVLLNEDLENTLELIVETSDGRVLLQKTLTVMHDAGSAPPPPPPKPALPKPISVATETGFTELAPENVTLPFQNTMAFVTVQELAEIPIEIYQEDMLLSTLIIKGFSSPVPANCRVEMKLEVGENYQMKLTVTVPSAGITKSQEIKLQKVTIPATEELRAQFQQLRAEYYSRLENMPDGDAKARTAAECDRLVEEIQEILETEHPERIQVFMLLKKLHILVRQIAAMGNLRPTKAEFETMLQKVNELLPKAIQKQPAMEQQRLPETIELLKKQALLAYQEGDAAAWTQHTTKVDDIRRQLAQIVEGGDRPTLPPAPVLKMLFDSSIDELEQAAAAKPKDFPAHVLERARGELKTARQKLTACDLSRGPQSQQELIGIYQQHIQTAEQLLDRKAGGGVLKYSV